MTDGEKYADDKIEQVSDKVADESISPRLYFLIGWREMLQPRNRILRQFYQDVARLQDIHLDPDASLDDIRYEIIKNQPHDEPTDENELNSLEKKVVLSRRLVGCWYVFWVSLVPLFVAIQLASAPLRAGRPPNVGDIFLAGGVAIVLFLIISFCWAVVAFKLQKPFLTCLNRVLGMPKSEGQ